MIKKIIKAVINVIRLRGKSSQVVSKEKIDIFCTLSNVRLARGVIVSRHASIAQSSVDKYSSIGRNTKISHAAIGSFCAISWDCTINALAHPLDRLTISAFPYVPEAGGFVSERRQSYSKVEIGNDVWIGAQVIVMPGIRIGDGAIIGAGSVVTKDVLPYEVVCGNPARHLRWRFNTHIREKLSIMQWWCWDDKKIKQNIEKFQKSLSEEDLDSFFGDCN